MKILVIDIGGTHVKIYATGHLEAIKVPSGPTLTPPKPPAIGVPQHEFHDIRFEFATIFTFWTLTAAAAPKNKEHAPKVGKKGEITLEQPTKVGDRMLQPGTYVVRHRVSGGDHFVRFVELKTVERINGDTRFTYTEANKAGEIKCRVASRDQGRRRCARILEG